METSISKTGNGVNGCDLTVMGDESEVFVAQNDGATRDLL